MPAYIIVEIDVHDPEIYEEYKRLTPASLAAHGGRFVVRGGQTETLEGDWIPQRIVVLNLPTWLRQKDGGVRRNMPPPKKFASDLRPRA